MLDAIVYYEVILGHHRHNILSVQADRTEEEEVQQEVGQWGEGQEWGDCAIHPELHLYMCVCVCVCVCVWVVYVVYVCGLCGVCDS